MSGLNHADYFLLWIIVNYAASNVKWVYLFGLNEWRSFIKSIWLSTSSYLKVYMTMSARCEKRQLNLFLRFTFFDCRSSFFFDEEFSSISQTFWDFEFWDTKGYNESYDTNVSFSLRWSLHDFDRLVSDVSLSLDDLSVLTETVSTSYHLIHFSFTFSILTDFPLLLSFAEVPVTILSLLIS